jgi:signal transduction histidine kinase
MKKIALVFAMAVLVPSLVLAWLAVRSLQHQQFLLERQESLLCQGIADALARNVQDAFAEQQRTFNSKVTALLGGGDALQLARTFDESIRAAWDLAEVGFVVTLEGEIVSPESTRTEARKFLAGNGQFLANRESAEVYLNTKQLLEYNAGLSQQSKAAPQPPPEGKFDRQSALARNSLRNVVPQQQVPAQLVSPAEENQQQQYSKLSSSPAEFRLLIGEQPEGTLARFVDNRLTVLLWHRPAQSPQRVFGVQLSLTRLEQVLRPLIAEAQPSFRQEFCLALLDDTGRPVAVSHPNFRANWRRPFVATEIGEILPHWETAVYLLNPAKLDQAARNIRLTLGLLIAVLVLAIGVGSWLIVADLNRQLTAARQKTDFVSNVSHELKTPLTSIRMFSELLAEGRVDDPAKQRSYLGIITAETARLTRLINNVLDFARIERGEKKYNFQACDFAAIARETSDSYRPNLEANGFRFVCEVPAMPVMVNGDRDALAQVIVNLLSNAEKYSNGSREVTLQLQLKDTPLPYAELKVLDRGLGVPRGAEEKIFEKFYRAHDSLSSGIQGSGLGLTLARQIARAHGGEVFYEPREGGGSSFILRLPVAHSRSTSAAIDL